MPFDAGDTCRWLRDIQPHIKKANTFAGNLSRDAFVQDELRVYSVTCCLEIISEASRRLPDELKDRHTGIEWQQMAAAGNVYRHEYENVAARGVWSTLRDHLPPLLAVVEAEIAAIKPHNSAMPRTTLVIAPPRPPKPPKES